jgi:hypothetical protein
VPFHHAFPWYSAFHGLNSTWMWTMGNPGPLSGYAPDLTNLPFFEASRQSLREIRSGIFALLRTGRRANDGIAIHYSEASRVADALFSETVRCTGWMEALADFNHAVEDCGLQYEYVASEEIEQDALRQSKFRVLIMPHSRAVSQAEAEAIRSFVEGGGLLIADILPGTLNGHGSQQEPGMLADLFEGARPGEARVFGKGKTVLLGDKLAGYGYAAFRHMQGWRKLAGRWRIMAEALEQHAGITPAVRVVSRGEAEAPPTEITRFEAEGAQFVGLLRKSYYYDDAPYPVTVRFADTRHLYDVRTGQYLGLTDSLDIGLSYEARLYARLPYRVQSLALDVGAVRGRSPSTVRATLRTDGDAPGSGHVVDFRVLSPEGQELSWYTQAITVREGAAEATIPWALNDPPGAYTVVARDVATGVSARQEVALP